MNARAWAEAIGVIGIIASVGLLTTELNQANRLARFTASAEISSSFNEGNLQWASNPDLADLLAVLADGQDVLTKRQVQQAMGFAYWQVNAWLISERAYREGLIDKDEFQMITLNDVEAAAKLFPSLKPYFRAVIGYGSPNVQPDELSEVGKKILEVTGDS